MVRKTEVLELFEEEDGEARDVVGRDVAVHVGLQAGDGSGEDAVEGEVYKDSDWGLACRVDGITGQLVDGQLEEVRRNEVEDLGYKDSEQRDECDYAQFGRRREHVRGYGAPRLHPVDLFLLLRASTTPGVQWGRLGGRAHGAPVMPPTPMEASSHVHGERSEPADGRWGTEYRLMIEGCATGGGGAGEEGGVQEEGGG